MVREGESFCSEHALPLQPCLVCTLGRWQHLMFHQLSSRSLTVTPLHLLLSSMYTQVKNSMQCAVGLLCIFQMKVYAAINKKKRGINQTSRVRRGICYSLVIPNSLSQAFSSLSLSLSTAVTWLPADVYHDPHYTSVVLSHIRDSLSQVVLASIPLYHIHFSQKASPIKRWGSSYEFKKDLNESVLMTKVFPHCIWCKT